MSACLLTGVIVVMRPGVSWLVRGSFGLFTFCQEAPPSKLSLAHSCLCFDLLAGKRASCSALTVFN